MICATFVPIWKCDIPVNTSSCRKKLMLEKKKDE